MIICKMLLWPRHRATNEQSLLQSQDQKIQNHDLHQKNKININQMLLDDNILQIIML